MRFNKQHLVDIPSLTKIEAQVFLGFLLLERERHLETALKCDTWEELWHSEARRQMEEVVHIDQGIEQVNKKFGLGDK